MALSPAQSKRLSLFPAPVLLCFRVQEKLTSIADGKPALRVRGVA